jgi:hypothetical protein
MRKVFEMMNCEEFELRGLDLDRAEGEPKESEVAAKHAEVCPKCRALLESWREVKSDLRILRESTRLESAPAGVEMRLKQELQRRRETRVPRRVAVISAWTLAVAAVLIGVVSWEAWQRARDKETSAQKVAMPSVATKNPEKPNIILSESTSENVLPAEPKKKAESMHSDVKDADAERFTLLPGSLPAETEEAAIVRVRMQRGALGAFGLPVNQERAGEWIQVDLLVGNDGLPQAVRLAR